MPASAAARRGLEGLILKNRLVFDGRCRRRHLPHHARAPASAEPSTEIRGSTSTRPSCAPPPTRKTKQPGYVFPESAAPAFESPIPPGDLAEKCDTIPYDPSVEVDPGTAATELARRAKVGVDVPHIARRRQPGQLDDQSGDGDAAGGDGDQPLAPANGLQTCTDAQFGKGTTNPVACPPQSKIGTATIESPPLPRRRPRRQRLRRQAAEPRPDLRQRVPDLHRRRVGPLRDRRAAARQRQRRPGDRAADDDDRRSPAGPVHHASTSTSTAAPGRCSAARRPAARTRRPRQMTPWSRQPGRRTPDRRASP